MKNMTTKGIEWVLIDLCDRKPLFTSLAKLYKATDDANVQSLILNTINRVCVGKKDIHAVNYHKLNEAFTKLVDEKGIPLRANNHFLTLKSKRHGDLVKLASDHWMEEDLDLHSIMADHGSPLPLSESAFVFSPFKMQQEMLMMQETMQELLQAVRSNVPAPTPAPAPTSQPDIDLDAIADKLEELDNDNNRLRSKLEYLEEENERLRGTVNRLRNGNVVPLKKANGR